MLVPEEYGGPGEPDFRYRYVVAGEFARAGANSPAAGFSLQDDIAIPYILEFGSARTSWPPAPAAREPAVPVRPSPSGSPTSPPIGTRKFTITVVRCIYNNAFRCCMGRVSPAPSAGGSLSASMI